MAILIRKARSQDAEEISKIWTIICSEKIYTAVNKPFKPEQEEAYIDSLSKREGIFLAIKEGQIVGFQSLESWAKFTDSFNHVGTIGTFIHPDWRRKKIGKTLADYVFNFAQENNYEKLVIYIRATNTSAIKFYKELGFIKRGRLINQVKIDNEYEDEIFMEMFL
jgi:ribosomal protein S18 acetylase RimI-like enzyme